MNYPFRLGTTSYIIPAGLLENIHYLAGKVQELYGLAREEAERQIREFTDRLDKATRQERRRGQRKAEAA